MKRTHKTQTTTAVQQHGNNDNHNVNDDADKVEYSWGAHVVDQMDGMTYNIAVWDYKGSRWSTYGPSSILERIFKCSLQEV